MMVMGGGQGGQLPCLCINAHERNILDNPGHVT